MKNKNNNPSALQRALVFQGGGSLGAYEAGVFHVLYHWIKKDLQVNQNVFDIIAGTSIGAINASIIINQFLENKEKDTNISKDEKSNHTLKYWEGSPEKLLNFWKKISSHSTFYDIILSWLKNSWDFNKDMTAQMFPSYRYFIESIVSGESLRRYYSTKKRIVNGEPYVFTPLFYPPLPTLLFNKFFDFSPLSAWWYQYSNQPLKEIILDFAPKLEYNDYYNYGGLRTNTDENEPRFLLIAANIETAKPETFDSYDNKSDITINHVLASAAIPINYPYIEINGNKYWDGGILSNTPVRELISSHNTFWTEKYESKLESIADSNGNNLTFDNWDNYYKIQKENHTPNLSLTIVNLHPAEEEDGHIPLLYDYDMTKDREKDIHFHDRTDYDLKLAQDISDYHDFVDHMTQLATDAIKQLKDNKTIEADNLKERFRQIVNTEQRTTTRDKEPRYFYDLIGKRFDINDVLKIQRKDDEHTISDKIFDFSSDTVSNLIKEGERDALEEIVIHEIEKEREDDKNQTDIEKNIYHRLNRFIENIKMTMTEDDEYIIQCAEIELKKKR